MGGAKKKGIIKTLYYSIYFYNNKVEKWKMKRFPQLRQAYLDLSKYNFFSGKYEWTLRTNQEISQFTKGFDIRFL